MPPAKRTKAAVKAAPAVEPKSKVEPLVEETDEQAIQQDENSSGVSSEAADTVPEELEPAPKKRAGRSAKSKDDAKEVAEKAPEKKKRAAPKAKKASPEPQDDAEEAAAAPTKKAKAAPKGRPAKKTAEVEADKEKKPAEVDDEEALEADEKAKPKPKGRAKKAPKEEDASKVTRRAPRRAAAKPVKLDVDVDSESEEKEQPAPKSKKRAPAKKAAANGGASVEEKDSDLAPPKAKKRAPPAKKESVDSSAQWQKCDFGCQRSDRRGNAPNFHVASWNVGGLRACVKKGGLELLTHANPDVLCLQETKCTVEELPEEVNAIGAAYKKYWCGSKKPGYAGVGILTKTMPIEVFYGIGSEQHDDEGRCITAEFKKCYLVNVYVPNAGRQLVTLPKRLEWNTAFKTFINNLNAKKPVIICGDMNVAHTEIDLSNPKRNTKSAGFTIEEREGLSDFLNEGYIDTFRTLYPDQKNAYTFWSYMSNARAKNIGWRLDYVITSSRLEDNLCDNIIHKEVLGSDHCPISGHFFL